MEKPLQSDGPCTDSYSFTRSPGWLDAERTAIGANVGANGYTTVAQAGLLADRLGLGPDSLLLDLGCGRGWPGAHIAAKTGCRTVLADMPRTALDAAALALAARSDIGIVQASGVNLPFAARSFDAISHADVLC